MRVTLTSPAHVVVEATCASCRRALHLECAGLQGFYGYQTYNAVLLSALRQAGARADTGRHRVGSTARLTAPRLQNRNGACSLELTEHQSRQTAVDLRVARCRRCAGQPETAGAGALGVVHRGVGNRDQRRRVLTVMGIQAHANARGRWRPVESPRCVPAIAAATSSRPDRQPPHPRSLKARSRTRLRRNGSRYPIDGAWR